MANRKPLTDQDGEVRELTKEDFARAIPFDQLPKSLQGNLATRGRGPQKAPTKERVTLRLSPEVVEHYRGTGPGWQTRIDEQLLKVVLGVARAGTRRTATTKPTPRRVKARAT